MRPTVVVAGALVLLGIVAASTFTGRAQNPGPAWSAGLTDIRRVAALVPGRRPLRVNMLKCGFARRTRFASQSGHAATTASVKTCHQLNRRLIR
jgi:hypothetical protein